MQIEESSLADYLGNASARGYVLAVHGRPSVQIHLFDEVYTVSWASNVWLPDQFEGFLALLDEVSERRTSELKAQGVSPDWIVALTTREEGDEVGSPVEQPMALPLVEPPSSVVSRAVGEMLDEAVSIFFRFGASGVGQWATCTVWTDTVLEESYRETGLTIDRQSPLPGEFSQLLMMTNDLLSELTDDEVKILVEQIRQYVERR